MKKLISCVMAALLLLAGVSSLAATCPVHGSSHVWSYVGTGEEAGCTTDGWARYECDCGAEKTETIKAKGHSYYQAGVSLPTCTEKGYVYLTCSRCSAQDTEVKPAYGHSWVETSRTKSTCSQAGTVSYRCSECGATKTGEAAKKEHTWGEWTITAEATESAAGTKARSCTVCGYTDTTDYLMEGTLYRDMGKNEDVCTMQQQLIKLGYLADKADGLFGKKTEAAVKAYQEANGIEVTGIAFIATQRAIAYDYGVLTGEIVPEEEKPLFCRANEDASVTLCERHDKIEEAGEELLAAAATDAETLAAYQAIGVLWQAELETLSEEYISCLTDEEQEEAREERAMAAIDLALAEKQLAAQAPDDPLFVAREMAGQRRAACCSVCMAMSELGQEE